MMTSETHQSGTDRCAEVVDILKDQSQYDIIVNIQGDEPFVNPIQIESLVACFQNDKADIATLVKRIKDSDELVNPNVVKAVVSNQSRALYFSRQCIPFIRAEKDATKWIEQSKYYKHIGVYAYRSNVLEEITRLPMSTLEKAESLEQLRWLDNGYDIYISETDIEALSVDTPEDLEELLKNI